MTAIPDILAKSPVRIVFGPGAAAQLGERAAELGPRALLVSDPAIRAVGHLDRAVAVLRDAHVDTVIFDGAETNPTDETVERGLAIARQQPLDLLIGLGGGSAMDCAKAVNLLLTNGGQISDYRGDAAADVLARRRPLLPMILVPTTAGTGSEAQSFTLISDSKTHTKMACGDRRPPPNGGLRPHVAILDPQLTRTMPPSVAAATGIDAITHAVETAGCRTRSEISQAFSVAGWQLLAINFLRAVRDPADDESRAAMLLGAHLAGCAIENAMLGAAHACANPLTATYDTTHGVAVGLLLPHVIRFNAALGQNPYAALDEDADRLARRIESLLHDSQLPRRLRECGVEEARLPEMAALAAQQWTATFNPRPAGPAELLTIYRAAF